MAFGSTIRAGETLAHKNGLGTLSGSNFPIRKRMGFGKVVTVATVISAVLGVTQQFSRGRMAIAVPQCEL
jgi:hypothetical protein